jgi:hypothetical protein
MFHISKALDTGHRTHIRHHASHSTRQVEHPRIVCGSGFRESFALRNSQELRLVRLNVSGKGPKTKANDIFQLAPPTTRIA